MQCNPTKNDIHVLLLSSVPFHHSPVPGNPTPPLTPNSSGSSNGSNGGNGGVGIPFASPASDFGGTGMGSTIDTKPPFYNDVKPGKLSSNQGMSICPNIFFSLNSPTRLNFMAHNIGEY